MQFSVKMRSAKGGPHEKGGRHISGAERILDENDVEKGVVAMLRRARNHQRGKADFISIKVEEIREDQVIFKPLIMVHSCLAENVAQGHAIAKEKLRSAGVSSLAIEKGFNALLALQDSIRGAMLFDAFTGERVDTLGNRGVRVTKMDCAGASEYEEKLAKHGLTGEHVREALVLASKVASAPGMVAELCWSDDPDYVTGYVASATDGYMRIPIMKEMGSNVGGRIFFVKHGCDVTALCEYLQEQLVLITFGGNAYVKTGASFAKKTAIN
jgi:6-carboxyhexanoate--CoA ligase